MSKYRTFTLLVEWDRDISPADLKPMGDPELTRDTHGFHGAQRHLGLHVIGTAGISLGLLAVRCGRNGELLTPLTVSIAD